MEAPNSLFSAIWAVHSLDNPKQRAVWWRDTMSTSHSASAMPQQQSPVASQPHPLKALPGKGRISSWVHTEGLRELRGQQLPGTTYSLILESQKNQLHSFTELPVPLLPLHGFITQNYWNMSGCQCFSHILAPPTINLLLLKCLWQKERSIKRYLTFKRYFQDFDSVLWGAQKSMNITKKFHSFIFSSSQYIITISLLQK